MTTKDTVTIPGRAAGVSLTFSRKPDPAEEARRLEVQRELGEFRAKYGRAEGDRNAAGMLMDIALFSAVEGVEWILDALMDAEPDRVLGLLRRAEQAADDARAWRAEQEAERRDREELEEAATRAKIEARRSAWSRWLREGGRDALASWRPTESQPETRGGVWWAVNRRNVVGVGATPGEAHADANRWAFDRLSDPAEAADAFDDPRDIPSAGLPDVVYTEADLDFLYVSATDPALPDWLGRDLTGLSR